MPQKKEALIFVLVAVAAASFVVFASLHLEKLALAGDGMRELLASRCSNLAADRP